MAQRRSPEHRSKSPSPPPWSPISPSPIATALPENIAILPVDLPPNVPMSESTNTDVIALRAALSVLQMQRLQSIRNIQTLDKQRELALSHPEEFRKGLVDGTIHSQKESETIFDSEDTQDEQVLKSPDSMVDASESSLKDFGEIPTALNVVRCPPVNWAKYHIAGEVLDQLHEQQRRLPHAKQIPQALPSRPYAIAAPYSPWHDKLVEIPKTKESGNP